MKNLLNLGKALNKAEQKNVIGGGAKLTHVGDEHICGFCGCSDGREYTGHTENGCAFMCAGDGWICVG